MSDDNEDMDISERLDTPVFNLSLSVSDAMLLQSCVCMMGYAAEGDLNSVAIYAEGAPDLVRPEQCDDIAERIRGLLAPMIAETRRALEQGVTELRSEDE